MATSTTVQAVDFVHGVASHHGHGLSFKFDRKSPIISGCKRIRNPDALGVVFRHPIAAFVRKTYEVGSDEIRWNTQQQAEDQANVLRTAGVPGNRRGSCTRSADRSTRPRAHLAVKDENLRGVGFEPGSSTHTAVHYRILVVSLAEDVRACSGCKGAIPNSALWQGARSNLEPSQGQSRVRALRALLFVCNLCSCFKSLNKAVSGKKLLKKALILLPKILHSTSSQRPRNAWSLAPSFWVAVGHQLHPIFFDHVLDSGDVCHANQCVFDHLKNQSSLPFTQSHCSGLQRRVLGEQGGVYKTCQMCSKQLHRETRKTLPLSAEEGNLKVLTQRFQLSAARFVNATLQPSNDLSVETLGGLLGDLAKALVQIPRDTQGDACVAVIVVHERNFPPKQCHKLLTPKPCHIHNSFTTPKQCLNRSKEA